MEDRAVEARRLIAVGIHAESERPEERATPALEFLDLVLEVFFRRLPCKDALIASHWGANVNLRRLTLPALTMYWNLQGCCPGA